eukprot:8082658-Lingulodinium_polyedra.AAC.1
MVTVAVADAVVAGDVGLMLPLPLLAAAVFDVVVDDIAVVADAAVAVFDDVAVVVTTATPTMIIVVMLTMT